MRGLIITALSVLALSGCGSEEPAREAEVSDTPTPSATSTPSDPTYVESDACRADAQTALEIVALALTDSDVRDVAGRLRTLEKMTPDAFAQCTGDVARPAMESIDAVSTAVDAAIMGTGGNVGKQLAKAQTRLDTAQAALVATN
jgi:hypothetical protein